MTGKQDKQHEMEHLSTPSLKILGNPTVELSPLHLTFPSDFPPLVNFLSSLLSPFPQNQNKMSHLISGRIWLTYTVLNSVDAKA